MKALKTQLEFELEEYVKRRNIQIETIFIGGGTPSAVFANAYEQIFDILQPYIENIEEITIEANPNSASKEWLKQIKNLGVNRVSFGVQSFNDDKLKFLGRSHSSKQAVKAIENAADIGFKGINLDIIYGAVTDTQESISNDINIVRQLPVNHISAYSLTLEEGTLFFNKSSVKIDDEELSKQIFDELGNIGFEQYEISNFAKEQYKSKHNLGYWQYKEYLGIGAGAVGFFNGKRYYPPKSIEKYIANPIKYEQEEILSSDDIKSEKILLGLRCEVGVDLSIFNAKELSRVKELEKYGKIRIKNNKLFSNDFLVADEIALYLLRD